MVREEHMTRETMIWEIPHHPDQIRQREGGYPVESEVPASQYHCHPSLNKVCCPWHIHESLDSHVASWKVDYLDGKCRKWFGTVAVQKIQANWQETILPSISHHLRRCISSRRRRTFASSRHSFIPATFHGEQGNTDYHRKNITNLFITLNRNYKIDILNTNDTVATRRGFAAIHRCFRRCYKGYCLVRFYGTEPFCCVRNLRFYPVWQQRYVALSFFCSMLQ